MVKEHFRTLLGQVPVTASDGSGDYHPVLQLRLGDSFSSQEKQPTNEHGTGLIRAAEQI